MKLIQLLLAILMVHAGVLTHAQTGLTAFDNRDAERQRIAAERLALGRSFDAGRAACYEKFLVNRCLDDVREQRRAGLSGLRRQEISLNDLERKTRAAAQLQQLDQKALSRIPPGNPAPTATPGLTDKPDGVSDPKPRQPPEAPSPRKRSVPGRSAGKDSGTRDKTDAAAARLNNEEAQARAFAEQQEKAQARRLAHEESQRNRSKPAARPLPAPP